jgi:hypothetical protein
MLTFPFKAILNRSPQSAYAADTMTIGKEYTVLGMAGCCWIVTNDVEGDTVMINPCWFENGTGLC